MIIKIEWYDGEVREAIVTTPNDAFSLCWALDKSLNVLQWRLDEPEHSFPWYHSNNSWKRLVMERKDWRYA